MSQVLTLIAKPLTDDHVRDARARLPGDVSVRWLAPALACDLLYSGPLGAVEDAVRRALVDAPVDLFCQENGPARRKQLLVADMDSTIITTECIDEMADLIGQKDRVAAITERAMAGEVSFADALHERARMLSGLAVAELQAIYDQRIRLTPGARELVATMKAHDAATALVSGGFTYFTERVAAAAGFEHHQANILKIADGHLTGAVEEPVLGPEEKLAALQSLAAEHGIAPDKTLAVGDGANDLAMVQAAALGVSYHGKPLLTQAADARIEHGDLTALLYFQGYQIDQFNS